jgi:hypothetical protein
LSMAALTTAVRTPLALKIASQTALRSSSLSKSMRADMTPSDAEGGVPSLDAVTSPSERAKRSEAKPSSTLAPIALTNLATFSDGTFRCASRRSRTLHKRAASTDGSEAKTRAQEMRLGAASSKFRIASSSADANSAPPMRPTPTVAGGKLSAWTRLRKPKNTPWGGVPAANTFEATTSSGARPKSHLMCPGMATADAQREWRARLRPSRAKRRAGREGRAGSMSDLKIASAEGACTVRLTARRRAPRRAHEATARWGGLPFSFAARAKASRISVAARAVVRMENSNEGTLRSYVT